MRLFGTTGQVDRVNWMGMPFSLDFKEAAAAVLGPYCVEAVQTYTAGARAEQSYLAGARAEQIACQ